MHLTVAIQKCLWNCCSLLYLRLRVKEGRIPIKGSGTTRSGGLSSLFNRLDLRHIELEEQMRKFKIASRDILDVALNVEEGRILRR